MKNDTQTRGQAEGLSKFPMSNQVLQTGKFLKAHDGKPNEQTTSLSEALKSRIGAKNEEALEKLFARVNEAVKSGVDYINENPNESKLVEAAGELAAWVKKQAQPVAKPLEKAADNYLPKVEAWIADLIEKDATAKKS